MNTKIETLMEPDIRRRLLEIRRRSKMGQHLSIEDEQFCKDCYKRFPVQYVEMGREVFESTKPFGSAQ